MKNILKLVVVVAVVKGFLFAVSASELPESNHHKHIQQSIEVAK